MLLRRFLLPGAIASLLVAVLLAPLVPRPLVPAAATALVLTAAAGWAWWLRGADRGRPRTGPGLGALALQLSPVLFLTAAYPLATRRMEGATIGGEDLPLVLLASSLVVPWLTQAVCLPLYRGIGDLVWRGDLPGARARFCALWLPAAVQSLPLVAASAVLFGLVGGWGVRTVLGHAVLCLLHVLFVQALVMTNAGRLRGQWAAAWGAYALALLVAPALWFLPPVAGVLVCAWFLRTELAAARGTLWLDRRDVRADLTRGLVAGSVMWSDKVFLYLSTDGVFPVQAVFVALLPAVIAYNHYFVRLAGPFDAGVDALRSAMEVGDRRRLRDASTHMTRTVLAGLHRAGLLASGLGLLLLVVLVAAGREEASTAAPVVVASCLFLLVAICVYQLDYIGRTGVSQVIGGAHLAVCAVAFATTDSLVGAYDVLVVGELLVIAAAVVAVLREWRTAEYSLFWRHATSW